MRVTVCWTVSASSQLKPGGAGGRCGVGNGAGVAFGTGFAAVPAAGRAFVGEPDGFGVGLGRGFVTVPVVGGFATVPAGAAAGGCAGPCSSASSATMQMSDLTLAS